MRYASAEKHQLSSTKNIDSKEHLVLPLANAAIRSSVENYTTF